MSVNAKSELEACKTTIAGLKDYQSKNWAIGMTGDTLQPDGFLAFFTDRNLPFEYYVRSGQGVSVGEPSAYDKNIATLEKHMSSVGDDEKAQVEKIIATLKDYQSKNWAIGLNGDSMQPDGFMPFFATRRLPFAMYVRSHNVSIGDPTAYDQNIGTLADYLDSL